MLSKIRQRQILHGIINEWNLKRVKLIETENRKVVARDWGMGIIGRGWEKCTDFQLLDEKVLRI